MDAAAFLQESNDVNNELWRKFSRRFFAEYRDTILEYYGYKKQATCRNVKYSPIMPHPVVVCVSRNVQFNPRKCGQNKYKNQNPVYYKNLFHQFPVL